MSRKRIILAGITVCVLLATVAVALAAESLTVTAAFSPNKLGAPTNVHGTATIHSTNELVPTPIIKTTVMGPAGLGLNVEGVGICNPATLEATLEPKACPTDSKAGFGGGTGVLELAKEVIKEHFTLNFFRGPNENGHLVLLAYLNAITPVSVQLVLRAQVVKEPPPYGLGFTFVVPLIPTLPGASDASAEEIFITLGAPNAAYYKTVHGKRTLFHVKGIIVPKKCPHGGFPYKTEISFADGTTNTVKGAIPCPGR
ncbi:MAG TPA: hypothetical protein VII53_05730 [Solirubrobacteraceae bacterium]